MVALELIDLDGLNPREQGAALEAAVCAKAESMRQHGQLSPIRLYLKPDGRLRLGFGHIRYLAAKLLDWKEIRAEILPMPADERDIFDARDLENLDHQALNPLEEMLLVEQALARSGGDIQKAAARLHRDTRWVRARGFVTRLAPEVRAMLATGRLAPDHARELAKLSDPKAQSDLASAGALSEKRTGTLRTPDWFRSQIQHRRHPLTVIPWNPASAVAGKPPCNGCPHNTASNPTLFEESAPYCMLPSCYAVKIAASLPAPAAREPDPRAFARATSKWRRIVVSNLAKGLTDDSRLKTLETLAMQWGISFPPPPKPENFVRDADAR
jgi:ParB/RepB/Spo0J family partition protein